MINELMKEIMEIIDTHPAQKKNLLYYGLKLITNENILENLKKEEIIELFKIVIGCKNIELASATLSVATNINVINSGQTVEITKLISACNKIQQEYIDVIKLVVTNEYIIKSGKTLEIANIVKNSKNKQEALTIAIHAIDEYKQEETPKVNVERVISKIKRI